MGGDGKYQPELSVSCLKSASGPPVSGRTEQVLQHLLLHPSLMLQPGETAAPTVCSPGPKRLHESIISSHFAHIKRICYVHIFIGDQQRGFFSTAGSRGPFSIPNLTLEYTRSGTVVQHSTYSTGNLSTGPELCSSFKGSGI